MTPNRLETFELSKPLFQADHFLICEVDGIPIAFLEFGFFANENEEDTDERDVSILALCARDVEMAPQAADSLLRECQKRTASAKSWTVRPPLPNNGFLGIAPADGLAGVTPQETRLCGWLQHGGYSVDRMLTLWELQLAFFQAPVDRAQIQIRRASRVLREQDEPVLPWWRSCLLGHTDASMFRLGDKLGEPLNLDALFWQIEPELLSDYLLKVWVWPDFAKSDSSSDQLVYLVAEALRQFQAEQIDVARTASFEDDEVASAVLHRLGFSPLEQGASFAKNTSE